MHHSWLSPSVLVFWLMIALIGAGYWGLTHHGEHEASSLTSADTIGYISRSIDDARRNLNKVKQRQKLPGAIHEESLSN